MDNSFQISAHLSIPVVHLQKQLHKTEAFSNKAFSYFTVNSGFFLVRLKTFLYFSVFYFQYRRTSAFVVQPPNHLTRRLVWSSKLILNLEWVKILTVHTKFILAVKYTQRSVMYKVGWTVKFKFYCVTLGSITKMFSTDLDTVCRQTFILISTMHRSFYYTPTSKLGRKRTHITCQVFIEKRIRKQKPRVNNYVPTRIGWD